MSLSLKASRLRSKGIDLDPNHTVAVKIYLPVLMVQEIDMNKVIDGAPSRSWWIQQQLKPIISRRANGRFEALAETDKALLDSEALPDLPDEE